MIPEQLPVLPLGVVITLAVAATGYAAYRSGAGALRSEPGTGRRRNGLLVAAAALGLSLAGVILMVNIMASHDGIYHGLAWKSLSENYGITPAADRQGFQPGIPFAAVLDGQSVSCTASPPDTVLCNGEPVLRLTTFTGSR